MGPVTAEITTSSQSDSSSGPSSSDVHIREVWAHNLEEEMDRIRDIADSYPYIAMVCRTFMQSIGIRIVGYGVPGCSSTSSRAIQGWSRL